MEIIRILAEELGLAPVHVQNVVALLDEGKTIPFIARYRKEKTGSMDDQTLRRLEERLERLRSIEKRREEILKALQEQEVLSEELSRKIVAASTLSSLEDI